MIQPQAELFDLYRAGLKTAADMMKASLESAERVQNEQRVGIRNALDQQTKSVDELGSATTLDELLALQTRMAGAQMERAMSYLGDLVQLYTENQQKAIGQIQEQTRTWLSEQERKSAE